MNTSWRCNAPNIFQHLAALALFSAAAYSFFAPPESPQRFSYFGYGADPLAYIWFLNWWPFALAHHLPLFYSSFVDYPAGASLAWKTSLPCLSLLAAPFTLRFGAVAVGNFLFIAAPALTAWGGYLAAFELTASFAPALTAGLIFGFSSYMIGQLQGHLNLVFIPALPLAFWLCAAAYLRGWNAWQFGLPLGCLLALQFGIAQEIFASFCMFAGCGFVTLYALHPAARQNLNRLIPGLAIGLILCSLIAAPLIWQMLLSYGTGRGTITPAIAVSNDLLQFLFPTPIDWLGGRRYAPLSLKYPGDISEEGAYIGLPLLLLLIFILWQNRTPAYRTLGIIALLAAVLSLGPWLHVWGIMLAPAPWILADKLPFLDAMLPARFTLYSFGAIALLLAFWLASPGAKWPRYATLAICLVFLIPSRNVDRNWTTLAIPDLLTDGTIPTGSNILILPAFGDEMGYQYAAGMRFHLVGQGYLGTGAPLPFARWRLFPALNNAEFSRIDPREFAAYLSAYHAGYVLVTNQTYRDYALGLNLDTAAARCAAIKLLQSAGWTVTRSSSDETLLQPPRNSLAIDPH
jgi:hypothetical protein